MSGLRVLKPGPQSLLQDAGRRGWQHLSVSPAGPLDWHGAAWANHLLNNPWGTPLLEIALGGLELQAEVDTWVAVCGAQVPLRKGQLLRLGFARSGQRAYLAVAAVLLRRRCWAASVCSCEKGWGRRCRQGICWLVGLRISPAPSACPGPICRITAANPCCG